MAAKISQARSASFGLKWGMVDLGALRCGRQLKTRPGPGGSKKRGRSLWRASPIDNSNP